MIRKVTLIVLTLSATVAFGVNLVGCPQRTWYCHSKAGSVTATMAVRSRDGALSITCQRAYDHQNPTWLRDIELWPLYARSSYFDHRRQRLHPDSDPMFIMTVVNELGLWALVVLFGAYPMLVFVRGPLRRYRLRRMGRCQHCGYDLTGNVSGRCPECGTAIEREGKSTDDNE